MTEFDGYDVRTQIQEILDHIVSMWDDKGLTTYKMVFVWIGRRWRMSCPENDDMFLSTDKYEMNNHQSTLIWRGFSDSYWMATMLFSTLKRVSQETLIKEMLWRVGTSRMYRDRVLLIDTHGEEMSEARKNKILWRQTT